MPEGLVVGWEALERTEVDLDADEIRLTTAAGDTISIHLGRLGGADEPDPKLPVVYLDQNHWVALAQARFSPKLLSDSVLSAANELIALAEVRQILLPFSSGHLVETVPRGKQRHDVAITMLSLSRGLQMRHPLAVRQGELGEALSGRDPRCTAPVFTLEPDAIFLGTEPVTAPDDFPPAWKALHIRVTTVTATVATMLEDADDPSEGPGPAARQRWLDAYAKFAGEVHKMGATREETRSIAHEVVAADLSIEAAQAAKRVGVEPDGFTTWLEERSAKDFASAPHIRTLEEITFHRLRDSGDRWEGNDLIDMQYLSCAAGYADLVIAEQKFGELLKRAHRRFPDNAAATGRLREGVAHLRVAAT